MTAMGMGLAAMPWGGRGGVSLSGAAALLGAETNGIAFSASDDSMEIRDTVTPANNYVGSTVAKFGPVRVSAATVYNSVGALVSGPQNMLSRSQEFDHADWSQYGGAVPITPNAGLAPDGTMTADRFTWTGITSDFRFHTSVTVLAGTTYTFSWWHKSADGNNYSYMFYDAGGPFGSAVRTATPVWQRASVTVAAGSAGSFPGFHFDPVTTGASPTGSVYIWGAQLVQGSVAGDYVATGASGGWGLRRDYDPRLSGTPKYLCEYPSTNLIAYSEQLNNAAWNNSLNVTVTPDAVVAPDGMTTADKVVEVAVSASHILYQATAAGKTLSGFFKTGGRNFVQLFYADAGDSGASFNLATGTVGVISGTISSSSIISLGNGWYRASITIPGTASVGCIGLASTDTAIRASYTGDGVSGIYAWGIMNEAGDVATSYIPTTSATVTRAGDAPPQWTALNISQTAGTLYVNSTPLQHIAWVGFMCTSSGSGDLEGIKIQNYNNSYYAINVVDGGVVQAGFNSGTLPALLTNNKAAIAYALNDFACCFNGGTVQTDATGTLPTTDAVNFFFDRSYNVHYFIYGWLAEGMQINTRKSNAAIQALTT